MKEILRFLAKIVDWIRVISSFLAFVYAISWFFLIFRFPFVNAISVFFEPIARIVRGFISHQITFEGQQYDSTYIITSLIFVAIFYGATKFREFLLEKVEDAIFNENIRRARMDTRTNARISKEFKEYITKVNYFIICLNLNLKYAISETLVSKKYNLQELKNENYKEIVETMSQTSSASVEIKDDKVIIISPNYANFEKIFNAFLDITGIISFENQKKDIATDIYFVLDGSEQPAFTKEKQNLLKKVLSFGYKNKAITTTVFAKRYEQEKNNAFVANTMGKIRFFEDRFEGQLDQGYSDFELFTLKRKRG